MGKCLEEHNQPRMTNSTPRKRYQPGHHKLPHLSRWYNDRLQQPWQRMENIKKKPPTRLNGSESTPRNHQTHKIRIFSSVEFEHLKSSWTKMLRYVRDLYIMAGSILIASNWTWYTKRPGHGHETHKTGSDAKIVVDGGSIYLANPLACYEAWMRWMEVERCRPHMSPNWGVYSIGLPWLRFKTCGLSALNHPEILLSASFCIRLVAGLHCSSARCSDEGIGPATYEHKRCECVSFGNSTLKRNIAKWNRKIIVLTLRMLGTTLLPAGKISSIIMQNGRLWINYRI